jgi:hypothetical protein
MALAIVPKAAFDSENCWERRKWYVHIDISENQPMAAKESQNRNSYVVFGTIFRISVFLYSLKIKKNQRRSYRKY